MFDVSIAGRSSCICRKIEIGVIAICVCAIVGSFAVRRYSELNNSIYGFTEQQLCRSFAEHSFSICESFVTMYLLIIMIFRESGCECICKNCCTGDEEQVPVDWGSDWDGVWDCWDCVVINSAAAARSSSVFNKILIILSMQNKPLSSLRSEFCSTSSSWVASKHCFRVKINCWANSLCSLRAL